MTIANYANNLQYVLLVETDETLAEQIISDLQEGGYHPIIVSNPNTVLTKTLEHKPALVVINRTLGSISGLEISRQIRLAGLTVPILVLVSLDSLDERVACLESGCDDFIVKPYHSTPFLQMVRFYLQPETNKPEQLRFHDLILDLSTRRAIRNGRTIELTMKEYELLKYLISHPKEVLTREQILENVWGYDFVGESNVIEVYIRYLRLKIEVEGEKRLIQTVRGVGYVLRET